jgi:PAS domain S-box-containing protein
VYPSSRLRRTESAVLLSTLVHTANRVWQPDPVLLILIDARSALRMRLVSNNTTKAPELAHEQLRQSDEVFRLLVEGVQDYAIFLLNPEGRIMTWNAGAERIKGYAASEIIGEHFSRFYSVEAQESRWPERELELAEAQGRFVDEGWRVRKDGTTFWASVVITALRGSDGELRGFSKVTRDLTERRALEERTQQLNKELRVRMSQLSESNSQLELRGLELQRLSGELVRLQDVERRRIARELHEDLGQDLVAVKMVLDRAPQFATRAEALKMTEVAISKVRNLSYLLHPPLLDESGLLPALHLYIEGFRKRSSLRINFEYKPIPFPRLSSDIETSVFRVIQEAILNIQRHASSPDARIEIQQQPDRIVVRVRDFGVGISNDKLINGVMASSGAGLGGLSERIKQLGGQFNILRAEPGTIVEAVIPIL